MWLLIHQRAYRGYFGTDAEQHGNYESNSQYHAGDGSADRETGREDAGFYRAAHGGSSQGWEHKTSTLQDLEAGRPLELEAIVGAVLEVGERIGLPMPHTRSVYACTKLLAERRGAATQKT